MPSTNRISDELFFWNGLSATRNPAPATYRCSENILEFLAGKACLAPTVPLFFDLRFPKHYLKVYINEGLPPTGAETVLRVEPRAQYRPCPDAIRLEMLRPDG